MFTHNLDPILLDFGLIAIRWYSLAYIFGIMIGWWYGRKIIQKKFNNTEKEINLNAFDDLITFLIISIILGGRIGYVIFYNIEYYIQNPIDIVKVWNNNWDLLFLSKTQYKNFFIFRCNSLCCSNWNFFGSYIKLY